MFLCAPGKTSNLKKIVYLMASTILGLLLSLIVHALIEINYLRWADSYGYAVFFSGGCALSPWLNAFLWLAGAVGGFFLGHFWWRKIYIEKVWARKRR